MFTIVSLQPAPIIDGISDDGHSRSQLPYPFHVYRDGRIGQQNVWQGDPSRVIGLVKDLARHQVDLWWADAFKDPEQTVGMYLVVRDDKGGMSAFPTAIVSVQKRDFETEI